MGTLGAARPNMRTDGQRAERKAARERFVEERQEVIARYRSGVAMITLARRYRVSNAFARARFADWNEPIRGRAEAQSLR